MIEELINLIAISFREQPALTLLAAVVALLWGLEDWMKSWPPWLPITFIALVLGLAFWAYDHLTI